jgi:hypothetical protein
MRIRNTIIALVLLALVGGYAYLVSKEQANPEPVKVYKIAQDDITQVDLKYQDREILVGRNKAGRWELLKPIHAEADQTTADNLARAIADCEVKRTLHEKPTDLKPFGLDKPQVIVTVTTKKQGVLPSIEVGKTTPVGFAAYIRTSDKPAILMTSSAFPPGMDKKVDDLRDRELMSFKVDDVQKLLIERDNGSVIEVDRSGEDWNVVKPIKTPADATQVRQTLSALANARVADFISDAPAGVTQYGLGQPRLTITVLTGKENARQSLLFGFKQSEKGKDGIYARRGERAPVYTVHEYLMSDVNKTTADLRDKTVLAVTPADVERLSFAAGPTKFSLERASADKWRVVDGGKNDADGSAVDRFLSTLRLLKGNNIAADPMTDPKKFGLDKPAEQVMLTGKGGKDLGWVKLAKVEEPAFEGNKPVSSGRFNFYVTSSKTSAVYTIDDYNFGQLVKTADQFRAQLPPTPAASPSK